MRLIPYLALSALTATSVQSLPQGRILGGSKAAAGQYPFIVYLHNNAASTFCGGSIIGQNWILTAAHCAKRATKDDISVYVGQPQYNLDPSKSTRVSDLYIHPAYNEATMSNDVALLRLASNISWTRDAQPINIDIGSVADSESVTALGWGFTEGNGSSPSKDLKEAKLTTLSTAQCSQKDSSFSGNNNAKICVAGDRGADTCPGDSGGPLVRSRDGELVLLGITSYGTSGVGQSIVTNCGGAGMVSLFTHVKSFLSYIDNITKSIDQRTGKVVGFNRSDVGDSNDNALDADESAAAMYMTSTAISFIAALVSIIILG